MAVPGRKGETSLGSDQDLEVYCQPCDRDGLRHPAHGYCTNCTEHLCKTCYTLHSRHTMSRHHTLLDMTNMPHTMSSVTPSQPDNLIKPCPKHNIETIKFYCHDHESLLCSICVSHEHTRNDCKISYIPYVSGQLINSKEYRDTLDEINDMTKKANKTLKDMKELKDNSNKSLTNVLTDIKKFRTKINQRIDELERDVEDAAKTIQNVNSRHMMKFETNLGEQTKSLKASYDAITRFNTAKQANDLFMELKLAEQKIKDYQNSLNKLTAFDFQEYDFEYNERITNMLCKERSIGNLKDRKLVVKLKSRQLSHTDKMCVKTSKDSSRCGITGLTLLNPNIIVITDYNNRAVKMVDISKKSVLDQHILENAPSDVSSVSHDEVAVTIPVKHTIQFLSVTKHNLKNKCSLKVDGQCDSISCHKDKMVVSFLNPGKLQILRTNGTVLKTIQYENILKYPGNVTTNEESICVSYSDMNIISKLNWQGEVKGTYSCRTPYGLALSNDGTVFVCSYYDNTITEVLELFVKDQVVVKDLQNPQAICWSAETSTLFTSSRNWDIGNDNCIRMFKF